MEPETLVLGVETLRPMLGLVEMTLKIKRIYIWKDFWVLLQEPEVVVTVYPCVRD